MTRLSRYLVREVLTTWLAVTVVLVVVLLANRLARFMAEAASGEFPVDAIFALLGLKLVSNLGTLLPASFFLAVMLALGRLYRDSEMTALAGCGVGPARLYRALFALAIPLAVGVAAVSLVLGPTAERLADQTLAQARQDAQFQGVQPGRFLEVGGATVYVAAVDGSGRMQGVFARLPGPEGETVVVAEQASRRLDPEAGDDFLVLEDGHRYDGTPGQGAWRLMRFARHGLRIAEPEPVSLAASRDALPPTALLGGGLSAQAELQWRLSPPVMVLVLALAALPLARSAPRSGRYGRLVGAVLIYLLYFNLLYAAEDWMSDGFTPPVVGVWWVHAVALVLALGVMRWRLGPLRWRERSA
ncbi:LPS export ABC transporter permease LptF [Sediminicurvatus halobius]|nr:LPS export ABC transporter permease LptF [Spiribacter halobius]UEX77041.1 LPS export ABC transporter permease LptF [Spiribacter halobius]